MNNNSERSSRRNSSNSTRRSNRRRRHVTCKEETSLITLLLTLPETTCQAGGRINGKVSMYVSQTATADDLAGFTGIRLSLEGQETVDLHTVRAFQKVVRIETPVVEFSKSSSTRIVPGQYDYPFCWQLPANEKLPVTMKCSSSDGSSCEIQYHLVASMMTQKGDDDKKKKTIASPSRQRMTITASGNTTIDDDAIFVVEPKKFNFKSRLRKRGFMEFGMKTNCKITSPGSNIAVTITGQGNRSTVPIKELLIQLIETVEWGRGTTKFGPPQAAAQYTKRVVLAETTLPVENLPQCWNPINKSASSHHETTIATNLKVSSDARDSYAGCFMIQVEHSLVVTAMTSSPKISNPEISTPIKVYRQQQEQWNHNNQSKNNDTTPMATVASLSPPKCNFKRYKRNSRQRNNYNAKLPKAVPIIVDEYNDDDNNNIMPLLSGCCTVMRREGESEQQTQYYPCSCCSTSSRSATSSESSSPSSSCCCLVPSGQKRQPPPTLQTATVLAVIA